MNIIGTLLSEVFFFHRNMYIILFNLFLQGNALFQVQMKIPQYFFILSIAFYLLKDFLQ